MSAGLSFSVTALRADDVATQEACLLRVAAACPSHLVFHDVLWVGEQQLPVRITCGPSPSVTRMTGAAPPQVGRLLGSYDRELFWLLEDHGDVIVPGLLAGTYEHELDLGDGDVRVLTGLDELAQIVEEHLEDPEFVEETEPETLEFLEMLRTTLAIAKAEQLPVVAHW